jgi:hypothetical protein
MQILRLFDFMRDHSRRAGVRACVAGRSLLFCVTPRRRRLHTVRVRRWPAARRSAWRRPSDALVRKQERRGTETRRNWRRLHQEVRVTYSIWLHADRCQPARLLLHCSGCCGDACAATTTRRSRRMWLQHQSTSGHSLHGDDDGGGDETGASADHEDDCCCGGAPSPRRNDDDDASDEARRLGLEEASLAATMAESCSVPVRHRALSLAHLRDSRAGSRERVPAAQMRVRWL